MRPSTAERCCAACLHPMGRFAVRCPSCGRRGFAVHAVPFAGRYLPSPLQTDGPFVTVRDRRSGALLRGTVLPCGAPSDGTAVRARALAALSACHALLVPQQVLTENGRLLALYADGPFLPLRFDGDTSVRAALGALSGALLVLHSLGAQAEFSGDAVHGLPSADCLFQDADGSLRLLVPLAAQQGEAAADIVGFGQVLCALCGPKIALAPATRRILERMRAGGYRSVLEIRHELNCL